VIVLGFDTSTTATAVALRLADGRSVEARDDPPPGAHPGHATRLLDLADRLLVDTGVAWSAIERLAVGVGPGTFTGLRVGVATARGLAQSLSIELVGISSTCALAAGALAALGEDSVRRESAVRGQLPNAVLAVIDARRGEVFAAAYEAGVGVIPHELAAPRALAPQDLARVLEASEAAAANAPPRWLAVGDGALRYRAEVRAQELQTPAEDSPLQRVRGAWICELGACAAVSTGEQVVPDYRRRPDAELALVLTGKDRRSERANRSSIIPAGGASS
jgi:tRNA threonylcarbamoyladenosine biosynthesis protein TsaB